MEGKEPSGADAYDIFCEAAFKFQLRRPDCVLTAALPDCFILLSLHDHAWNVA